MAKKHQNHEEICPQVVLSGQEAERFFEIIENPKEPSEKMKEAARRHRERLRNCEARD